MKSYVLVTYASGHCSDWVMEIINGHDDEASDFQITLWTES